LRRAFSEPDVLAFSAGAEIIAIWETQVTYGAMSKHLLIERLNSCELNLGRGYKSFHLRLRRLPRKSGGYSLACLEASPIQETAGGKSKKNRNDRAKQLSESARGGRKSGIVRPFAFSISGRLTRAAMGGCRRTIVKPHIFTSSPLTED
jgi:hypothetical protein